MGKIQDFIESIRRAYPTKEKPEKTYQAKKVKWQSTGVVLFWLLMVANLFFLMNVVAGLNNQAEAVIEEKPTNPATSVEAVEFGKQFAAQYFTWRAEGEGWQERGERLAPFMAAGLDEQAGLIATGQTWNSKPNGVRVLQMEPTGSNQAMITYEIDQVLSKEDEDKVNVQHVLTVPVQFESGYGVYDLPSFTAVDKAHAVAAQSLTGESVSAEERQEVQNFLGTFFTSYTTDTPDSLSYLLEGDEVKGLEGTMVFETVKELQIVKGAAAGEYKVEALVVLREPTTETGYNTNYHLIVAQKDGRYVVKSINKGGNTND